MNIVIIGSAHPLRGGLATFNERMAKQLQDEGHSVIIYSFSLQYPNFLFPGKTQFTDEAAPKDLKIKSLINSINPLNWIKVGNKLKKQRPDLIIIKYWLPFMGPCFGTILRIAKKNKHTKVISVLDNVIPHEKRPGDVMFTNYFLKPVDAFLSMSKEVLKDLRTFTNKEAVFSPHPLYDNYGAAVSKEMACEKLGLASDEKYLLFFGFIRKYKGLDLLLEAIGDERIRSKNLKLIVAGEFYEDRGLYDGLIAKYSLHENVKLFTEFIPNEEVRYYFSAADVVVQPYKSATQSGITQIAYHFEKPMIVTNVGGLPEVVPDGKVGIVAVPEAKSIADAIVRFYDTDIPGIQQHILEEKRKYSWEVFVEKLMGLYKSALN